MERYEVLVGLLNLRKAPNGAILATLPRATQLEATGQARNDEPGGPWLPVRLSGAPVNGFVCERFVARIGAVGGESADAGAPALEVTEARLLLLTPTAKTWIVSDLARQFATVAGPHDILKTPRRLCHFLAQAAHETAGFRTLEEYGGQSYWQRYEGRADLGNTQPGDGVLYHGRGIFQLTGRANYRKMGEKLELTLENDPHQVLQPDISLRTACEYWKARSLHIPADANDIVEVTRRVNGGRNGLAERQTYFRRAWSIWGEPQQPPPV
jgi:putative chitinase